MNKFPLKKTLLFAGVLVLIACLFAGIEIGWSSLRFPDMKNYHDRFAFMDAVQRNLIILLFPFLYFFYRELKKASSRLNSN